MKERASAFRRWLLGKNIAVIGLGISGEGMLETLQKLGTDTYVFDRRRPAGLSYGRYLSLEEAAEKEGTEGFRIDLAVISPGVPLTSAEAKFFLERGVPLVGEMEFAYRLTDKEYICISGTNGKTTTTSLSGEIFARYANAKVVGNIGVAAAPYALEDYDLFVAEISSFQIETLDAFRPKICALLNITPDHLDRHGSFECYTELKLDLLGRAEIKVINADCPVLSARVTEADFSELYRFSVKERQSRGAFVEDGKIYVAGARGATPESEAEYICDLSDIHLMGSHNVENVLAAVLVARLYGIPAETIRPAVAAFRAVEHRIEYVRTVGGVRFYNDSKGTNPDSTIKAIEAMDAPCHLIAGGYEKNSDFTELLEIGKGRIASLSLIGVTAERIRLRALELGYPNDDIKCYAALKEAVEGAFACAKDGEIVLLSPASASWGMYKDFEERGRDFKSSVMKIDGNSN